MKYGVFFRSFHRLVDSDPMGYDAEPSGGIQARYSPEIVTSEEQHAAGRGQADLWLKINRGNREAMSAQNNTG